MTEHLGRRSDRIVLTGVTAHGHHGVYDSERELGQEYVVDVALGLDTRPAAAGDDFGRTVDYGVLAQRLYDEVSGEPVALIETLAQRLADVCLAPPVDWVEVTVHKPHAPIAVPFTDVSLTIHRSRHD